MDNGPPRGKKSGIPTFRTALRLRYVIHVNTVTGPVPPTVQLTFLTHPHHGSRIVPALHGNHRDRGYIMYRRPSLLLHFDGRSVAGFYHSVTISSTRAM